MKLLGVNDQYHINLRDTSSKPTNYNQAIGSSEVCHQSIPTSSIAIVWVAEHGPSGDSQSGVKRFSTNSSGSKWYLGVPVSNFNGEADQLMSTM